MIGRGKPTVARLPAGRRRPGSSTSRPRRPRTAFDYHCYYYYYHYQYYYYYYVYCYYYYYYPDGQGRPSVLRPDSVLTLWISECLTQA